jgi:hypothetical protein
LPLDREESEKRGAKRLVQERQRISLRLDNGEAA